jgi:RNA polymerase sigma factor (sigma-70 family)
VNLNDLYNRAREGGDAEKNLLFDTLSTRFRLLARQKIRDPEDVDEVVQEAVLAVCQEFDRIRIETSFSSWAYKVLSNRLLRYFSRSGKVSRISEEPPDAARYRTPEPGNEYWDLRRKLLNCLEKIAAQNPRYARILNLHYQGYDTEDICRKLSLNRSNFYSILSRARSMLGRCLERGNEEL